jgi:hypothetical protein
MFGRPSSYCALLFHPRRYEIISRHHPTEEALHQVSLFWEKYGEQIVGYSEDCISAIAEGMFGRPVKFALQTDLEQLSSTVRPREVRMTLGYVMNKYAAPTIDPATIDRPAPQIPPVGNPLPNSVPTNPSPAPSSGRTLAKVVCKEAGKVVRDQVDDSSNPSEDPKNYCDRK